MVTMAAYLAGNGVRHSDGAMTQQFARGERLAVELGDVPVALGAVVARVDDRLAGQRRGGRPRPQSRGQVRECSGTARVAEHHLVPGLDGEPRDGTADLSASDESRSRHVLLPFRRAVLSSCAGSVAIRVASVSWRGSIGRCPNRL